MDDDPVVDRAHIDSIARRLGLSSAQVDRYLSDVKMPAKRSTIAAVLSRHGYTISEMMSELGGSP